MIRASHLNKQQEMNFVVVSGLNPTQDTDAQMILESIESQVSQNPQSYQALIDLSHDRDHQFI